MPAFRFRLATLLKLRCQLRDERRGQLAQALEAEAILTRQAEELSVERRELKSGLAAAAQPGDINVDRLLAIERRQRVLEAQQQQLAGQRQRVAAAVEERRQALVAADREVRVLEKLAERQQEAHAAEQRRLEAAELDEIGLVGFNSRREVEP